YWLKGPDAEAEWGNVIEDRKDNTVDKYYPSAWKNIATTESGQFETKEGLFTFTTINPELTANDIKGIYDQEVNTCAGENCHCWKMLLYIEPEKLVSAVSDIRNGFSLIFFVLFILSIIGSWTLAIISLRRKLAEEALQKANEELETKVKERTLDLKDVNAQLSRTNDVQKAINKILHLSLDDIPLQDQFERILDAIMSIDWINLENRACIFLANNDNQVLNMATHRGISELQAVQFSRVPFNSGFCGRAAITKNIEFAEDQYIGDIHLCGDYAIPIISFNKLLGILHLKIKSRQKRDEHVEEVLRSVAVTLAGIIERHNTMTALKAANQTIQETRDELVQAAKMQVLGTLASGVAHEVKNPLAVILQGVDYLKKNVLAEENNLQEVLRMIDNAVKRADSVIKGLLDFARPKALEIKEENINNIIEESLGIIKYQLVKYKVSVIKNLQEEIPPIKVDKNKISHVVINLLINAIHAMPDSGGQIIIHSHLDNHTSSSHRIVVRIEDDGEGIPPEMIDRLFDPFFTTRHDKGGTGLGLSIVQKTMEEHKGSIEIKNRPGGGVQVTLKFKVAKQHLPNTAVKVVKECPVGDTTTLKCDTTTP
ncbi:MAG: ATP-binding protein, partial [Candidatus Margulisiibacteriota bacterium]